MTRLSFLTTNGLKTAGLDAAKVSTVAFALLLGSFMVYGVGFAHNPTLHQVAHDGRHSFAFPCH